MIALDHLVVAAAGLDEGAAWVQSRLGVAPVPGGRHDLMGTHNRLLSLGSGRYLEVIAVDPGADSPRRARWFGLDEPATRERLLRGPALIHWVVRTDDVLAALAALGGEAAEVISMQRGEFRWRIGVPASGGVALQGIVPTVIQWEGTHPCERLPDSGCRLEALVLGHPEARATLERLRRAGLDAGEPVQAGMAGPAIAAAIRAPGGRMRLPE